jgi:DNA-binding response OmpR family regulator
MLPETPCNQTAARPDGGQANPPLCILVVEDDRNLRQINATVLTHAGYAVDMDEDGDAAREALQAKRCELMITDNHMPRLTGIELLNKLRSTPMGLPVIMVTGLAT